MLYYKFKFNNDKTEIMLFGTKLSLTGVNIISLKEGGTCVHISHDPVRNLGSILDNSLSRGTGWFNQIVYI